MYWDKVARFYDTFESLTNRRVYEETGRRIAKLVSSNNNVLECACGTGAITACVAPACKRLTATDFSEAMLEKARTKCRHLTNVTFERADIASLSYKDATFDVVVAGNVIHLIDDPFAALAEMSRVCVPGGKVIVATYINVDGGKRGPLVKLLEKSGAGFKRQFDRETYREFFESGGYCLEDYGLVEGRMPCAIAVVRNTR